MSGDRVLVVPEGPAVGRPVRPPVGWRPVDLVSDHSTGVGWRRVGLPVEIDEAVRLDRRREPLPLERDLNSLGAWMTPAASNFPVSCPSGLSGRAQKKAWVHAGRQAGASCNSSRGGRVPVVVTGKRCVTEDTPPPSSSTKLGHSPINDDQLGSGSPRLVRSSSMARQAASLSPARFLIASTTFLAVAPERDRQRGGGGLVSHQFSNTFATRPVVVGGAA